MSNIIGRYLTVHKLLGFQSQIALLTLLAHTQNRYKISHFANHIFKFGAGLQGVRVINVVNLIWRYLDIISDLTKRFTSLLKAA